MVKSPKMQIAEKRSPLHDLAMPRVADSDAGVELSERLCGSLVQVQAWPDTIEKVAKVLSRFANEDTVIMQTGPGRSLVDSEEAGLEDILRDALPTNLAAITGLTHARVVVSIDGPKAEWVLASGIALDFAIRAFPVGSTQVSHHHEIGITIHRTGEMSFDLYVFTSLSRAFWKWIEKAGGEVGLSVG